MLYKPLLTIVALAGICYAQTEDIPDTQRLDVVFGPQPIHAPGALMHPGHMSNTPNISTPSFPPPPQSALLFMVDLDWPLENTRVSRLHWLVTDLTLTTSSPPLDGNNTALLNIPDPHAVAYLRPAAPVGDIAHSYNFYLFAQPAGFTLPSQYSGLDDPDSVNEDGELVGGDARAPFDVQLFLSDCGLDEGDLLARNHVRVRDLAGHATTSFPPARAATGVVEDLVPEESRGAVATGGQVATGGARGFGCGMLSGLVVMGALGVGVAAVVL